MSYYCYNCVQICDPCKSVCPPSQCNPCPTNNGPTGGIYGCGSCGQWNNCGNNNCNNCGNNNCNNCGQGDNCGNNSHNSRNYSCNNCGQGDNCGNNSHNSRYYSCNNCGGRCRRDISIEDSDRKHSRLPPQGKRCNKCYRYGCECVEYYPCLRTKCGYISAILTKSASLNAFIMAGQVVGYTYTITNTGDVPICYPIQICDDKLGGWIIPCSYIPPGGSQSFVRTYTITAADLTTQSISNNAVAYIQVKKCKWVCAQTSTATTITFGNADVFGSLTQASTGTTGSTAGSVIVTVNIGNLASSQTAAFGVSLFLPYPAGVTVGSISGATATTPVIGINGITISEATIPVGTTYTYRFTYGPVAAGAYTWYGTVKTSSFDPNLANNQVGPNTFIIQ